jgi:hypothetical protein
MLVFHALMSHPWNSLISFEQEATHFYDVVGPITSIAGLHSHWNSQKIGMLLRIKIGTYIFTGLPFLI